MKTKIIPFDIELAKKIQAGEIQGKIMYNNSEVEILGFDMYVAGDAYLCAKTKGNSGEYRTRLFDKHGKDAEDKYGALYNLYFEVPDNEPQFKPFDRVLVRDKETYKWFPSFYATTDGLLYYTIDCKNWKQCIQYEGNEHLVGTTYKPKEE